jgi:mRNA interferase MazF
MTTSAGLQWSIFEIGITAGASEPVNARRSVLVVSRETANTALPIVTVLPLATHREGRQIYPNEVLLPSRVVGLDVDTVAMAHQTATVPKRELAQPLGSIDDPEIRTAVRQAIRVQLNLEELDEYRIDR